MDSFSASGPDGPGAAPKRVQKQVYTTPELREYGDLKEITLRLSTAGALDGGLLLSILQLLRTSGLIL
ncbi:hypothetical protein WOC76_23510 [Methylocystis sp. IM3]|uniref:hypothetical protein n=1 Tax=unclassified Methylocystis TaxID=2625913 RepID=UPI00311936B4